MVLRADDPVDGPVPATLSTRVAGDRYAWRTVTAPVTGTVDVFAAPGACLRELAFTAD